MTWPFSRKDHPAGYVSNAQRDAEKAVELGLDARRLETEISRVREGRLPEIIILPGAYQSKTYVKISSRSR